MWGFLFFLAAAAAIALLVWNYQRRTQQREALSQARFEEMVRDYRGGQTPAKAMPPVVAAKPAAAALNVQPATAPQTPFLTQPETLVYYLLRTAIPDHAIFAKVPLSLVIGASGGRAGREAEGQQVLLDFVVCDRNMRVAAVVDIGGAGIGVSNPDKVERLRSVGVRLTAIDVSALPSRNEIRTRVLGKTPPVT